MPLLQKVYILSLCLTEVLGGIAPVFRGIERYDGQTTGRHIITIREGASVADVLALAKGAGSQIVSQLDIINGFSGYFDEETLKRVRSQPDVALVEEDGIMHTMALVTQTDAPWGLARLSTDGPLPWPVTYLNFTYIYDSSAGRCADIYVVDTGIYTAHGDFGGRPQWGATFGGYANADGNGHGTHCAGTTAGKQFGVSKFSTVYAVKVLSDAGAGSTTDIVAGLNWVLNNARSTGRPSVVSISLGGGVSTALDSAVATLTSAGIHVAVAAGNSNVDVSNTSPARVPSAVTVGASTFDNTCAISSNFGSGIDVFAPGQDIISTWIGSPTATKMLSGTSMATQHIAGLIAYLLCAEGNITPAAMSTKIKTYARKGILNGIPSGTFNYLAHNSA